MNVKELVRRVKEASPELATMPNARAARLLHAAFSQISAQIDAIDEGVVKVVGLGNFRVRQLERERGGKKERARLVVFRPPQGTGARERVANP